MDSDDLLSSYNRRDCYLPSFALKGMMSPTILKKKNLALNFLSN